MVVTKSKKNKKRKAVKGKPNGAVKQINSIKSEVDDQDEDEVEEPETPNQSMHPMHSQDDVEKPLPSSDSSSVANGVQDLATVLKTQDLNSHGENSLPRSPTAHRSRKYTIGEQPIENDVAHDYPGDTEARLDALARERALLREEVAQLRKSLELIQENHNEEVSNLQTELNDTRSGKDQAETQYRNLLGRVNTIKSQLGERLKADAVCISPFDIITYADINLRKSLRKRGVR